jgi:beta-glucosidase
MEPGQPSQTQELIDDIKKGTIKEADLDKCVERILELIVKTPRFNGYGYSEKPDLKAHAQVARSAASQGMVLLKNDNETLPMGRTGKIALFGATSIDFVAGGTGSGNVNKAYVVNLEEGLENCGYTLDKDLVDYYKAYVSFERQEMKVSGNGGGILLGNEKIQDRKIPRSFIDRQVEGNDVAIVVIGRNSGEGKDRKVDDDFNLSDAERQLITDVCDAFHQASKKVIVVLNVGGVIETYSWNNLPDAILLAWQPGQEGGNAVADILSGKVNPSGRLAMTFPVSYMDHPSSLNFPYNAKSGSFFNPFMNVKTKVANVDYTDYSEGIWVGYRYFSTFGKKVAYPFGYGLSYTVFSFTKPVVKTNKEGGITASVVVTNTGKVSGKKVVELYVSAPGGGLVKPSIELKAFAKTGNLAPGESQTVTMKVDSYSLASFNADKDEWETAAGTYTVKFANDATDVQCESSFKLHESRVWRVHHILGPEKPLKEISLLR